jgi:aminopeptidase N
VAGRGVWYRHIVVTGLIVVALAAAAQAAGAARPAPGPGVSEALARERAAAFRDVRYELAFDIPSRRNAPVLGQVTVTLTLQKPHRVVLDFQQPRDRVREVRVGDVVVTPQIADGHIVIPASATRAGENRVSIDFTAGDEALNRNDDFLYALFVPARAQLTFPCFDQPDIKARYQLKLRVPATWEAATNGAVKRHVRYIYQLPFGSDRDGQGEEYEFGETAPLPTYLFSFAAGKFSVETSTVNGRTIRMFHRETDAGKVARNRQAIFELHDRALTWLEDYTSIPYPFGKFDFVLIPSFQFGGMEHPGSIFYNQSGLMLDESATQNQLLERASLIAHETAHMWFGDLVTMKWFNDVWMKEVFANFMAAKIVNPSFPQVNHDLRFLLAHYPQAYQVDRTQGTNPIRQPLANLRDAGQLYGPIIYQKAPIVMRQLELIVGETAFRDGLREYLRRYQFGNATWLDLVDILDALTPQDVRAWSRAWVEERGRPSFATAVRLDAEGRIAAIALTQRDAMGRGLTWPQRLTVSLGYADGVRELPVTVTGEVASVPDAAGLPKPLYVLPNGGGLGYGLFVLDAASRDYLLRSVDTIADPLTRGAAWVTLWDNFLEGRIAAPALLDTALRAAASEGDEQNTQRILAYATRLFWRFLPAAERSATSTTLETALRAGLDRATTQSRKAAWFNAYRDTVLSRDGLAWLERVWKREERVPGLTLAEPDEIAMALELAVREVPGWKAILDAQLERTQNPDRKARFAFVMPALSADPAERERAFARFRDVANRRREPWVLESLVYLNHPLRETHARRFVAPALELLREIQRTGDIFFPTRWMDSTLWGHRSPQVAATVRGFLTKETNYPQRLRWTILSTSDELFRAAR